VYLHYVLDLRFEREIKPRLEGHARLIPYADDFVMGFEREEDAVRVLDVLKKRMAKYGLTLHRDKTRLIPFVRPRCSAPGRRSLSGHTWLRGRASQPSNSSAFSAIDSVEGG
jgi:hypothetical protein